MIIIGKENRSNQFLCDKGQQGRGKTTKKKKGGEGEEKGGGGGRGGGRGGGWGCVRVGDRSNIESEGLGRVLWVYKVKASNDQSLQWQSLEKTTTSLSFSSSILSQFILCNYFKVCTNFSLEGAE